MMSIEEINECVSAAGRLLGSPADVAAEAARIERLWRTQKPRYEAVGPDLLRDPRVRPSSGDGLRIAVDGDSLRIEVTGFRWSISDSFFVTYYTKDANGRVAPARTVSLDQWRELVAFAEVVAIGAWNPAPTSGASLR